METKVMIFENQQFGQIRCMKDENGNPWFVGKDVAEKLGYSKPLDALQRHVEEDDSVKHGLIDSLGRTQQTIIINESGLYSMILSSKLPQAREFKHWVTAVVLPQIRQTGGFINVNDNDNENTIMARALMIANKSIELKDRILEQQRPKVIFADAVTKSVNSILVRDLAKMITQAGVPIGAGRLFYWLRLNEYIFKRELRPRQEWVEKGIFEICVTTYQVGGKTFEKIQTRVTGTGQEYFVNGFVSGRFCAENGKFRG